MATSQFSLRAKETCIKQNDQENRMRSEYRKMKEKKIL